VKIFVAPVGTPFPIAETTNNAPVSLDADGVTEWQEVRGLITEEEAWRRLREAAKPAIAWVAEQVKQESKPKKPLIHKGKMPR
jgi:hypothetical protein